MPNTLYNKNKGRLFQQWVRNKLLEVFTTLRPDDVKSTSMGAQGEDIQLSPFARDILPIQIECKSHKHFAVNTVYDQAKAHGRHEPVVFLKANHKKPLMVVDAELGIKMMEKYYASV